MANKGKSRHIKGLNAPRYFSIHKKEQRYVTKPNPGRHTLERSVALLLLAKKLGLGVSEREARTVIKGGQVTVNGKKILEPKYPVGLNDIVEADKRTYRVSITNLGQVTAEEMKKGDSGSMLYKVIGKYKTDQNRIMLRLHDGSVIGAEKSVNVNDSVMIDSKRKIVKELKFDKGAKCMVIDGVHVGVRGEVKTLIEGGFHRERAALIKPDEGAEFQTLVKNVMVTG